MFRKRPGPVGLTAIITLAALPLTALLWATSAAAHPLGDPTKGLIHTSTPGLAAPGVPGPPTAIAGDGRVTVTITPPTSGGAVASYIVRVFSDSSFRCFITSPATSCVVTDLMNGVPYTFQSSAINDSGQSTWSPASTPAVTPTSATSTPTPTATATPTPTATITAAPVGPILKLAGRVLSSTGAGAAAPVSCTILSGVIARCVITLDAIVSGHQVAVGYGVVTTTLTEDLQQVTVPAVLTELGRYLAARPGGFQATVSAELIQRDRTGSTSAKGSTNVVARTYSLPRSIEFAADSPKVPVSDAAYLVVAREKVAAARTISCVGHADSRERGRASLGLRRAEAACAIVAKGLDATVHNSGRIDQHPRGDHNTPAGRAHNRRVVITISN